MTGDREGMIWQAFLLAKHGHDDDPEKSDPHGRSETKERHEATTQVHPKGQPFLIYEDLTLVLSTVVMAVAAALGTTSEEEETILTWTRSGPALGSRLLLHPKLTPPSPPNQNSSPSSRLNGAGGCIWPPRSRQSGLLFPKEPYPGIRQGSYD